MMNIKFPSKRVESSGLLENLRDFLMKKSASTGFGDTLYPTFYLPNRWFALFGFACFRGGKPYEEEFERRMRIFGFRVQH